MLNIVFERTSAPITDTELLSVIDGIRPAIDAPGHPDKDYALLLARLVLRIDELKIASPAAAWEPKFEVIAAEQERLAIQFCNEIAGPAGGKSSLPDPVRLLEMAEALYRAERDDPATGPMPAIADPVRIWNWLKPRFVGYDFEWGWPRKVVAVFEVGTDFRGGRDIEAAITGSAGTQAAPAATPHKTAELEDWQKARLEYTEDELYRLIVARALVDGLVESKAEFDAQVRQLGDLDEADKIIAFHCRRPGCIAVEFSGQFECACGVSWAADGRELACRKELLK